MQADAQEECRLGPLDVNVSDERRLEQSQQDMAARYEIVIVEDSRSGQTDLSSLVEVVEGLDNLA